MTIAIQAKLKPFSHKPGQKVLIPFTDAVATVYPTLIEISRGSTTIASLKLSLGLQGGKFTVTKDLEAKKIIVDMQTTKGALRYELLANNLGIYFKLRKAKEPLELLSGSHRFVLKRNDELLIDSKIQPIQAKPLEKLFLGCHKKQEWENIHRRALAAEFMPFWYALGQMVPSKLKPASSAALVYFNHLENFKDLGVFLQAAFQNFLIPSAFDETRSGLFETGLSQLDLSILRAGYLRFRSTFASWKDGQLTFLPRLFEELHTGKLLGFNEQKFILDFEWSKKTIRKAKLFAKEDFSLSIDLKKGFSKFRLRSQNLHVEVQKGELIHLKKGQTYFLDRFKKSN